MTPACAVAARAPGKLILCGEHGVVYGAPALALAVDRYVTVTVRAWAKPGLRLQGNPFTPATDWPLASAPGLKAELEMRHARFRAGELPAAEILRAPAEFIQYAAAQVLADAAAPRAGCVVEIASDIPFGSGMGSSAALALALTRALAAYWRIPVRRERLYAWARQAENLRHGRSSGLDPRVCLHGGGIRFQAGRHVPLTRVPPRLLLAQTGVPLTGTGDCVEAVAQRSGENGPWREMTAITRRLAAALAAADQSAQQAALRAQQRLLTRLGVTPAPVAAFIRALEQTGAAAKICGAGAVAGRAAGLVWIISDDEPAVTALARAAGYDLFSVRPALQGARLLRQKECSLSRTQSGASAVRMLAAGGRVR